MPRKIVLALVLLGLLISPTHTFAQKNWKTWRDPENVILLPQYCQDRLDKHGKWTRWKQYFGPVYIHMHHYCAGIHAELMAQRTRDKRKRADLVNQVVRAMQYVSQYCDQKCVIYAELHRRLAWGLLEQKKFEEAAKHLQLMGAATRK